MEKILDLRFKTLQKALTRLESSLQKMESEKYIIDYDELRDSIIQRFEFSVDTLWKFLKLYIQEKALTGEEIASPRKVFRACIDAQIISPEEFKACMKFVEDRNLTSHTYNQELAQEISKRIPDHLVMIHTIITRLDI